jgi:adenosylhomocysteinase
MALDLKEKGAQEIAEVARKMPVLRSLEQELSSRKTFDDFTLAVNTHLETKAGYLIQILADSGARVLVSSPTPRSVEEPIEAVLKDYRNVELFVGADWSEAKCQEHWVKLLEEEPDGILDDGCHLLATAVKHKLKSSLANLKWYVEQTTRGVREAQEIERNHDLPCPLIAVGSSELKADQDSSKGTGESVINKISELENIHWGQEIKVVIVGFGHVGQGLTENARARGADVTVTEIKPMRALKASTGVGSVKVRPLLDAIRDARIVIGATGTRGAVRRPHFAAAPDGCVFANAASRDDEILLTDLEAISDMIHDIDENRTDYYFVGGKRLRVLTRGWPVNLAVKGLSKGHPAEVIDLTFSLMVHSATLLVKRARHMRKKIYYPSSDLSEIDEFVASRYLKAREVTIDQPYNLS